MTRRYYAVLAKVSLSYPPLQGRLVTCYSPVRHFTQVLLPFLVRLACVRHAASVDSEPGSNSRLKLFVSPLRRRSEIARRHPRTMSEDMRECSYLVRMIKPKLEVISRLARSTNLSKILKNGPPERCPLDRGPGCYARVSSNLLRSPETASLQTQAFLREPSKVIEVQTSCQA